MEEKALQAKETTSVTARPVLGTVNRPAGIQQAFTEYRPI